MSKQLAVASAFSVFALSALALFGPSVVPENSPSREFAGPVFATDFVAPLVLLD